MKEEFQTSLQSWLQENGEALMDIYLHHSGGGGTLYLLKSANQVESAIEFALSMAGQHGDGQATITGFRSGYYPLRGNADESFIEKNPIIMERRKMVFNSELRGCFSRTVTHYR